MMTSSKLLKLLRSDTLVVEQDGATACAKAAQELIAFVIAAFRRDGRIVLPEFKKLAEILAEGLVIADLLGYARTMSLAGVELTRTHGKMLGVLRRRLKTDPAALARLETTFQTSALRVMSNVRAATEKKLQRAVLISATKGEHVRDGVKRLKRAFDASGITPRHKSHLETIYRTQTRMAYSAGRYQAEQHEAVQEILWGYRYVTTGDDRVRENHIGLHGTVAPKDDPIWTKITPPNGWNCRCELIPLFRKTKIRMPPKMAVPDRGFSFNPGTVFTPAEDLRYKLGEATGRYVSGAAHFTTPTGEIIPYPDAVRAAWTGKSKTEARRVRKSYVKELEARRKAGVKDPHLPGIMTKAPAPTPVVEIKIPAPTPALAPPDVEVERFIRRRFKMQPFAPLGTSPSAKRAVNRGVKKVVEATTDLAERFPELIRLHGRDRLNVRLIPDVTLVKGRGVTGTYGRERGIRLAARNSRVSKVTLGEFTTDPSLTGAYRHEYAHRVYRHSNWETRSAWSHACTELDDVGKSISTYAKTNVEEGFCEAFSAYTHPKYARGMLPANVEKVFDDLLKIKVKAPAVVAKIPVQVSIEMQNMPAFLKKTRLVGRDKTRTTALWKKFQEGEGVGPRPVAKVTKGVYKVEPLTDPSALSGFDVYQKTPDLVPTFMTRQDQPSEVKSWVRRLSRKDRNTFTEYTSGEKVIKTFHGTEYKHQKMMENLIARAPKADGTFYRGLSSVPKDVMKNMVPGAEMKLRGVTSVSRSPVVADRFGKDVFIRIKTKSAVDIRSCSMYYNQEEFLIPRGTRLKIVSRMKVKGRLYITVEEIEVKMRLGEATGKFVSGAARYTSPTGEILEYPATLVKQFKKLDKSAARKMRKAFVRDLNKGIRAPVRVPAPKPVASSYVDDALKRAAKEKDELDTLSSAQLEKRRRQAQRRAGSKPKVVDDRYEVAPMKQPSTAYPIEPYAGWTDEAPRWKDQPKEIGKWVKKQSYEENMALGSFTEGGGFNAKFLDVALSKAPKARGTFYRGMYDVKSPKSFVKGGVINCNNVTSMSRSPVVADEFAKVSAKGKSVFMEIRAKNAVDMRSNSSWYQQEFVLREKTKLKILSSTTKGDRIYVVAEEITKVVPKAVVKAPVSKVVTKKVEDVVEQAIKEKAELSKLRSREFYESRKAAQKRLVPPKVVDREYTVKKITVHESESVGRWKDNTMRFKDQPKEVGQWVEGLRPVKQAALGGDIIDTVDETVRIIEKAIIGAPRARGTFYRGISNVKDMKAFKSGAVITHNSGQIVSRSPLVADKAAKGKNVFMEIRAKRAIDIRSVSKWRDQEEFLLQPRARLKIVSTTTKGDRLYVIAEEIDPKKVKAVFDSKVSYTAKSMVPSDIIPTATDKGVAWGKAVGTHKPRADQPAAVKKWVQELKAPQKKLLERYVTKSKKSGKLEDVLRSSPKAQGTFYRGMSNITPDTLRQYQKGGVVKLEEITSITRNPVCANMFGPANSKTMPGNDAMMWKIRTKKAVDIRSASGFTTEEEFLLLPDAKLRIISVTRKRTKVSYDIGRYVKPPEGVPTGNLTAESSAKWVTEVILEEM